MQRRQQSEQHAGEQGQTAVNVKTSVSGRRASPLFGASSVINRAGAQSAITIPMAPADAEIRLSVSNWRTIYAAGPERQAHGNLPAACRGSCEEQVAMLAHASDSTRTTARNIGVKSDVALVLPSAANSVPAIRSPPRSRSPHSCG